MINKDISQCQLKFQKLLQDFTQTLHSAALLEASRLKETAFTRHRVLSFPVLLALMLSGFKASVQNELDAFFAHLINQSDLLRKVSAQAFSKARQQFSAQAFTLLNASWHTLVEAHFPTPRWLGLRVVAADASKMSLFLNDATGRKAQEAMAFALYLPASEMTLSARLYGSSCGERQMLFEHLEALRPDDLLLLDRGYPASWLMAVLAQRAQHFCMRVDALGFSAVRAFLRSNQAEMIVEIAAPAAQDALDYECAAKSSRVRLIRVVTPNGRVHALMTSYLMQKPFLLRVLGRFIMGVGVLRRRLNA